VQVEQVVDFWSENKAHSEARVKHVILSIVTMDI